MHANMHCTDKAHNIQNYFPAWFGTDASSWAHKKLFEIQGESQTHEKYKEYYSDYLVWDEMSLQGL